MRLENRVALVTGAGSGLGREIALCFAREGAKVGVNDIQKDAALRVVEEIRGLGREAMPLVADVSDSVEVGAFFEELIARFGTVDILVNNAGIALMSDEIRARLTAFAADPEAARDVPLGATSSMSDSQWRRTLSVHLDGTFYCMREALRVMQPRRSGRIINLASVAGLRGLAGSPDYSAAKAGIIGLTKSVAREVIGCGVYVNAIAPGFIDTPLLDALPPAIRQAAIQQTPIGRLGTVQEIAAAALYLADDQSSFTVGQVLSPNGGYDI